MNYLFFLDNHFIGQGTLESDSLQDGTIIRLSGERPFQISVGNAGELRCESTHRIIYPLVSVVDLQDHGRRAILRHDRTQDFEEAMKVVA